jgi:hypothetical protein
MKTVKKTKCDPEISISINDGAVFAVNFPDDCPYPVKIYDYDTEGMDNIDKDKDGQECFITEYPSKKPAKGDRKRPSTQTKLVRNLHAQILEMVEDWELPVGDDIGQFEEDLRNVIVAALGPKPRPKSMY